MAKLSYLCLIGLLVRLLTAPALAQIPNSIDSLETYLRTHPPADSNYVRAINRTARKLLYEKADYERADSLLRQSEKLAQRVGWSLGLIGSYSVQATRWYLTNNPQKALVYFNKTIDLIESTNRPKQELYDQVANVAVTYQKLEQWDDVMQTSLKAIRIQEQYHLTPRSNAYSAVGQALKQLGKPQQALPYYQKALSTAKASEDKKAVAIAENQIGNLYDDLKQPADALTHYQRSLQLAQQAGFALLQADGLTNIARMMDALKRPADGLRFAEKSLRIAKAEKNEESMATAYCSMGLLHQSLKSYPEAESNLKKALALAQKNKNDENIKLYTQGLADLYAVQNKYQQAYMFQLEKNKLVDSATTIRTNAEVQRLLTQYQTEKKEVQIKLLQKEKQLQQEATERAHFQNNALVVGGILLLLLSVAISIWLLNRSRLRRLEETLNLRKQIAQDLHDEVGSTLSSISLLSGHTDTLLSQNRPETAQKMVQKIYTDARQILESIDEIIWTINPGNDSLQRIMFRLREYAQPLMDAKNIHFTFEADPALSALSIPMEVRRNLYLIGKEAINNLVKYSQATQAVVRFSYANKQLMIAIEDNGRGFDPSQPSVRAGQQSMKDRAEAIGGSLAINSVPAQGTSLTLTTTLTE